MLPFRLQLVHPMVLGASETLSSPLQLLVRPGSLLLPGVRQVDPVAHFVGERAGP